MFQVKTPPEVFSVISDTFSAVMEAERIPSVQSAGRILAEDILASEYVPGFQRSTVDGYAVAAASTFGCSDSLPAILPVTGEILMGEAGTFRLSGTDCAAVPTGGAVPEGADAVVMIEYTEDYGDGTIGVTRPVSPGQNMIYRGDDVFPGKLVLPAGRKLTVPDIGALAAMGITAVSVRRQPRIGIISTGDELVSADTVPADGQIRDVNSSLLEALCLEQGAVPCCYGIIADNESLLEQAVKTAVGECDVVLISGGSSVGVKDATARVIERHGRILLHGIAMKPGKPTILGEIGGKPVFGLPGHPVAAFFVSRLFVRSAIHVLTGFRADPRTVPAVLTEALSTNHGRAEVCGVRLRRRGEIPEAEPVHTKSGLISALAGSDGYIFIPRDCEGLPAGARVEVTLYSLD